MDKEELKELVAFMNENDLAELEVEIEGKKIRLRKKEGKIANPSQCSEMTEELQQKKVSQKKEAKGKETLVEFKSPLVGTFYRAPKPDASPYIDVGDEVTPDKVICIIEAMKIMNEIKAETTGIIKEIRARNGQAVEYGEVLFIIEQIDEENKG